MSYWLELHCDAHLSPDCTGQDHSGPMTGCPTVEIGRSFVLKEAKRRGWKTIGGQMHCSACVKFRKETA